MGSDRASKERSAALSEIRAWTKIEKAYLTEDVETFEKLIANESSNFYTKLLSFVVDDNDILKPINISDETVQRFVKILLNFGADVYKGYIAVLDPKFGFKWENGLGIISRACLKSSVNVVRTMIDHGCDLHKEDDKGHSPIYHVFNSGRRDMIELILQFGIDASEIDRWHLLHNYVRSRRATGEIVKRLLQLGADVNGTNESNNTVLYDLMAPCIDENGLEIFKLLLEHGADPNSGQISMLATAAQSGNQELVELLLKYGANINGRPGDATSPITHAAASGKARIVELLLDRGARRDDRALYLTVDLNYVGNTEVVKLLLERGFDPNCVKYSTLIFRAVVLRNRNIVNLLLDYGVQINNPSPRGQYLLHVAASDNCVKMVQFLVYRGADVNVEFEGKTALSETIEREFHHICVARVLVRQVALLKVQNLFVSERNLNALKSKDYVKYYGECISELEFLTSTKFEDSDLSYFDISKIRGIRKLTSLAGNPKIYNVLKSRDFKMKFFNYGDMIVDNFDRGVARNRDFELLMRFVNYLSTRDHDQLPKLPFTFVSKLFYYLNENDVSLLRKL